MNLTNRPVYQKGQVRRRARSSEEIEDEKFRDWIRTLPCCICDQFREFFKGKGRSQAAHVRLGGRGGTAFKPLFSSVPLCKDCHGSQHNSSHEIFGSKTFWLALANLYLMRWRKKQPSDSL